MDVGSLIFSLGFKTEGENELASFNDSVHDADNQSMQLKDAITQLSKMFFNLNKALIPSAKSMKNFSAAFQKILKTPLKPISGLVGMFKQMGGGLKNIKDNMSNWHDFLNPSTLATTAFGAAITHTLFKAAEFNQSMHQFGNLTGLSTTRMQELQQQFAKSGVEAGEVVESIRRIQDASAAIKYQGIGNEGFAWLGLSPDDSIDKILSKIEAKSKTMNRIQFVHFAQAAGLSEGMISGILDNALKRKVDKHAIVSPKQIGKGFEAVNEMKKSLGDLEKTIGEELMPSLVPVVKMFSEMARDVTKMVSGIVSFVANLKSVSDLMTKIGEKFDANTFKDLFMFMKNLYKPIDFEKEYGEPTKPTVSPKTGASTNLQDNSNKTININVNGAQDPQKTAMEIQRYLQDYNNQGLFTQPVVVV